jgi:hypothetical protein
MVVVWIGLGLCLLCLTPLLTIFLSFRGCQFYWWRKPEYPEKATDLPQVTGKLKNHELYEIPTNGSSGIIQLIHDDQSDTNIASRA